MVETGPLAAEGPNHAPSNAEWFKLGREALIDAGRINENDVDNWQFELVKE